MELMPQGVMGETIYKAFTAFRIFLALLFFKSPNFPFKVNRILSSISQLSSKHVCVCYIWRDSPDLMSLFLQICDKAALFPLGSIARLPSHSQTQNIKQEASQNATWGVNLPLEFVWLSQDLANILGSLCVMDRRTTATTRSHHFRVSVRTSSSLRLRIDPVFLPFHPLFPFF